MRDMRLPLWFRAPLCFRAPVWFGVPFCFGLPFWVRVPLGLMLLCAGLPAAPAAAQVTTYAVVPNRADDNVSIIDTSTRMVVNTVPVTGDGPVAAVVSPDGAYAYVVNADSGTLSVIDLVVQAETTAIPGFTNPARLVLSPDGRKAYVANVGGASIVVVDLATNTISATLPAGGVPSDVSVSPNGQSLYVTLLLTNKVVQLDAVTGATQRSFATGAGPSAIALTPDGTKAYTANALSTDDSITVLDLVAGTVLTTLFSGSDAELVAAAVSPDGREVYVAGQGAGVIAVVDVATDAVLTVIPTSVAPQGIAFTPDGRYALITSENSNPDSVVVIDTATRMVVGSAITVGNDSIGPGVGPNVIVAAGGPLSVANDAALDALSFRSHLNFAGGTLALTGNLTTSRTVTVRGILGGVAMGVVDTGGFTATLSGSIRGENGVLRKLGAGTLVIAGDATHLVTSVEAGRLIVRGSHAGTLAPYTGEVAGTGTIGRLEAQAGSTVRPGENGPGELTVSRGVFASDSTLAIELNGPAAVTGYDRLTATDVTVLQTGAILNVSLGYAPAAGTTFVIATNVFGEFAGLPEGALLTINDTRLRLSYIGGDGNDLALTALADLPPTLTAIADQQVLPDTVVGPLSFTIGDDWTAPAALSVGATSSNHAVVPDANVAIGGSDAARTLTITPLPGAEGSTTISVSVTDDAGQVTTVTFTVTVGARVYYLSEGATGAFFDMDLLLANPTSTPAPVTIQFLRDDGTVIEQTRTLAPTSRTTIAVDALDGLEATVFSTIVRSTAGVPLAVERTMWWGVDRYGAHTEKASDGAATEWLFAEGVEGFFKTYFLLANPQGTANVAHVTYYRQNEGPIARDYPLAAHSRTTIDVSDEAELRSRMFGARVTFDHPGMAERAMYFGENPFFSGGGAATGVTAPATTWYFAEGATGSFFSTYLLLANGGVTDAAVTLTHLRETGLPIVTHHTVPAGHRLTVDVAGEDPALAFSTASTIVTADHPIVAERSVYWPKPTWIESHTSAGVTAPARTWALAEGRVGGPGDAQTFILLGNPNATAADVTLTFLRADGTTLVTAVAVPAMQRVTVRIAGVGSDVPDLRDEHFGARIDASQPIVVERSLYTTANGVIWASGTNATATRLPD
jgi:YVTN family beta-propeller protein